MYLLFICIPNLLSAARRGAAARGRARARDSAGQPGRQAAGAPDPNPDQSENLMVAVPARALASLEYAASSRPPRYEEEEEAVRVVYSCSPK
eukprot:SAG31_NODE_3808_length_3863_cov_4.036663_2_plen_92_part_00